MVMCLVMASAWTKEAEENFIELVKERRPLYDITDSLYSNRIVKSRLWKEIEAEVHLTEKEFKKKWESLRTQYLRYKKVATSGSAAAHLTGRQVWVLNRLQFLEAHTRRMSSVSNLSSQESMQNADAGSDNRFLTSMPRVEADGFTAAESVNRFPTPSVPLEDSTLAEVPTAIDAPRVSSSWTEKETIALLDLWGDESIQVQLNNTLKNTHIYSLLSGKLADLGFHKSPSQWRFKVNNLTHKYRREKANGGSKHRGSTWFGLVDAVLGRQEVDLDGTPPKMSQDGSPEKVDIPGVGHLKPQGLHTCTHCSRGFRLLHTLQMHVRTHTEEPCHICHICGKTSIQHLARHMLMHKGEKNYLCTKCGKAFLSSGELRRHTRTHTGERPYPCKLCGKGFRASCYLTVHMRSHTGEKPYSCTLCHKAFSTGSKLKRHMFIHYDKKPYECFKCGKGFTQSFNMKLHIRTCKCIKEMGR